MKQRARFLKRPAAMHVRHILEWVAHPWMAAEQGCARIQQPCCLYTSPRTSLHLLWRGHVNGREVGDVGGAIPVVHDLVLLVVTLGFGQQILSAF